MPDRMPEGMPDRMPDKMSDRIPEDMPDKVPECLPDRMPEDMPDRMPEDMPDKMPEYMPDRMPEGMPDRMSDRMPEGMSDKVPECLPEHMPEDCPDRMPEDMPDKMPEDMPDRMPEGMPGRMPEGMSDKVPECLPEHMPEDLPDRMPEDMPDKMPEDMSDRMPEDLPVTKRINVMVGITRSKKKSQSFPHIFSISSYIIQHSTHFNFWQNWTQQSQAWAQPKILRDLGQCCAHQYFYKSFTAYFTTARRRRAAVSSSNFTDGPKTRKAARRGSATSRTARTLYGQIQQQIHQNIDMETWDKYGWLLKWIILCILPPPFLDGDFSEECLQHWIIFPSLEETIGLMKSSCVQWARSKRNVFGRARQSWKRWESDYFSSGWWFQPLWKIWVSRGYYSQYIPYAPCMVYLPTWLGDF